MRATLTRIGQFLNDLAQTAEQLSTEAIWVITIQTLQGTGEFMSCTIEVNPNVPQFFRVSVEVTPP